MPDWIAKANIDHFKKLLGTEKDPRKRAMIEKELAEEEAKLADMGKQAEEKAKAAVLKKQRDPKTNG